MAATNNSADRALTKIRATPRPEFIRLTKDDGEVCQIGVPDIKRWKSRVSKIVDSMEWRSICPIDVKGNVVGEEVENDEYEEFQEMEDISLGSKQHQRDQELLSLMLKAQSVALDRQKSAYDSVLQNNAALLEINLKRTISLENKARDNLDAIQLLHEKLNEATIDGESGPDPLVGEMLKMVVAQKMGG